MRSQIMWSDAQRQAYIQLCEMGEVFFGIDWPQSSIKPRLDPLIVGPTGVGKSHLVRAVAERLKVPLLRLSYGEWIVTGGRGHPTLSVIRDFVNASPKGIIHIDEVDKARTGFQTDWSIYTYTEMFFLLDRNIAPAAHKEKDAAALNLKLQEDYWVIGSGTWQALWDTMGKRTIGFGPAEESHEEQCTGITQLIQRKEIIPKELLKRFCNELVIIPPPCETDFELAADIFGIEKLAKKLGIELDYQQAVHSESGARWLEETYGSLLMHAYRMGRSDLLQLRPEEPSNPEHPPYVDDEGWDPEIITE